MHFGKGPLLCIFRGANRGGRYSAGMQRLPSYDSTFTAIKNGLIGEGVSALQGTGELGVNDDHTYAIWESKELAILMQEWEAEEVELLKHAQSFFECVNTVLSSQLKGLVQKSAEECTAVCFETSVRVRGQQISTFRF